MKMDTHMKILQEIAKEFNIFAIISFLDLNLIFSEIYLIIHLVIHLFGDAFQEAVVSWI